MSYIVKECVFCGRVKPFSEFYSHQVSGLAPRCKSCIRVRARARNRRLRGEPGLQTLQDWREFLGKPNWNP